MIPPREGTRRVFGWFSPPAQQHPLLITAELPTNLERRKPIMSRSLLVADGSAVTEITLVNLRPDDL